MTAPSVRGQYNFTLLHHAAWFDSTSCIRVLLRFAPHLLNAVSDSNDTPVLRAVYRDRIDATKILLQAGADIRTKNKYNATVFDWAIVNDNKEMMEILKHHQQVS